jgi:hypothetical protein
MIIRTALASHGLAVNDKTIPLYNTRICSNNITSVTLLFM